MIVEKTNVIEGRLQNETADESRGRFSRQRISLKMILRSKDDYVFVWASHSRASLLAPAVYTVSKILEKYRFISWIKKIYTYIFQGQLFKFKRWNELSGSGSIKFINDSYIYIYICIVLYNHRPNVFLPFNRSFIMAVSSLKNTHLSNSIVISSRYLSITYHRSPAAIYRALLKWTGPDIFSSWLNDVSLFTPHYVYPSVSNFNSAYYQPIMIVYRKGWEYCAY